MVAWLIILDEIIHKLITQIGFLKQNRLGENIKWPFTDIGNEFDRLD